MNFANLENGIINYFQNNLPAKVTAAGLDNIEDYVNDFIDLDKYRHNAMIFFDFSEYHFENLSLDSRNATCNFDLYLILRNKTPTELQTDLLNYTDCIYNFYYENSQNQTFGGLVDVGIIQDVELFSAFAGNNNIKLVDFTFKLDLEDI